MGRALILETTFLIDLEREHNRGIPGRAVAFLEANGDAQPLSVLRSSPARTGGRHVGGPPRRWEGVYRARSICCRSQPDVGWEYGRAYRHLRGTGQLIGTNDLWIAATALAYQMAVVTDNVEHFRRVPHLEVESY